MGRRPALLRTTFSDRYELDGLLVVEVGRAAAVRPKTEIRLHHLVFQLLWTAGTSTLLLPAGLAPGAEQGMMQGSLRRRPRDL